MTSANNQVRKMAPSVHRLYDLAHVSSNALFRNFFLWSYSSLLRAACTFLSPMKNSQKTSLRIWSPSCPSHLWPWWFTDHLLAHTHLYPAIPHLGPQRSRLSHNVASCRDNSWSPDCELESRQVTRLTSFLLLIYHVAVYCTSDSQSIASEHHLIPLRHPASSLLLPFASLSHLFPSHRYPRRNQNSIFIS